MIFQWEDLVKLLLALAVGGVIGVEREMRDKAAGFRTNMFICAGSALFTIFSYRLTQVYGLGDPVRIAAQIVTGVGFLGAGTILRENGEVRGLTTAATIWLVAALGMGVGGGLYLFSTAATVMIVLGLWLFPSVERLLVQVTQYRTYMVTCRPDLTKYQILVDMIRSHDLKIRTSRYVRQEQGMVCSWIVSGRPENHQRLVESLFGDPDVISFDY
jgi:putative Mg2+ transporter-C (MgtC) family protein